MVEKKRPPWRGSPILEDKSVKREYSDVEVAQRSITKRKVSPRYEMEKKEGLPGYLQERRRIKKEHQELKDARTRVKYEERQRRLEAKAMRDEMSLRGRLKARSQPQKIVIRGQPYPREETRRSRLTDKFKRLDRAWSGMGKTDFKNMDTLDTKFHNVDRDFNVSLGDLDRSFNSLDRDFDALYSSGKKRRKRGKYNKKPRRKNKKRKYNNKKYKKYRKYKKRKRRYRR